MIKKFIKSHPIHKIIVPYLDFIFLIRPTLFFSIWVMVVIGMYSARVSLNKRSIWLTEFSWETFFIFLGLTLTCASTFISNQIKDIKSDNINKKLFLVGNYISKEKSLVMANSLLILGISISIVTNWFVTIFIALIYLVWGIVYNKEPFNWNKKPILGWLANTIIGLLLFMLGWFIVTINSDSIGMNKILFFKSVLPYLLCFSSVSLLTTVPDIIGDRIALDNTFPIVYGKTLTFFISLILVVIASIIALLNNDPLASTSIIVSLPFFLFTAFRKLEKDVLRSIRYPIFILNFFSLVIYPMLSIPLLIIFYLSKYYYWHRFNLHYPTFLVEND